MRSAPNFNFLTVFLERIILIAELKVCFWRNTLGNL